jgi:integrase
VYRGFLRAREAAGLDIRYHDLRHMVASALARSQADLRLSMDIMGHRSVETHRRYVHTDLDARRRRPRQGPQAHHPAHQEKEKGREGGLSAASVFNW